MKYRKTTITLFAFLSVALFAVGCTNRQQDPVNYSNKLMALMNKNIKDTHAMNMAMTSGDYRKAEDVREKWASHLKDALRKANRMDDFNGNDGLKTAVINGLKDYRRVITEDYKQLLAIRIKGDTTQQAKENELLGNINDAFLRACNTVKDAASVFQARLFTQ